ncbi:TIGR02281 family clan AA aspartic protease [Novosphingobium sp. FKTRR1]|uniref:retropepsin-like aspartic protease family protein n=1 Tax=Novosphingobium sp. FKTRR1 TaxID=2879118 RepID=UPI001CF0AA68|nr:TIGR02281 family clan AA aspartic protease [Novosphingobium sp. FKTRR1]
MDSLYRHLETAVPWLLSLPPLVVAALVAIALSVVGSAIRRPLPLLGAPLRLAGNLILLVVFGLAVLRFVREQPGLDGLGDNLGTDLGRDFGGALSTPAQTVAGGETRVPLARDGHYWIAARVNGARVRFMVDTGATLTALSQESADAARLKPDPLSLPVTVRTANGAVQARMARLDEVRFGSIVARDMDAIVTPTTGGLNVLGMNFLSRLKGWRVEEGVLILTPRHPQAETAAP